MKLTVFLILFFTVLSVTESKKSDKKGKKKNSSSSSEESSEKATHYQLFSTSTAYDTIRNSISKQPKCKPEALWAFIRHGTRYPHIAEIDRYRKLESVRDAVLSNHANGKGKLEKFQLKLLRKWGFKGTNEQEMHLTASGYKELVDLGKRLKNTFPDLLHKNKLESINLIRTSADRTTESAAAVTQGLFGTAMILPNSSVNDTLLKNGKKCPFWKTATKSPELKKFVEDFKNSSHIETLVSNINKRLGFENELNFGTVKDMYDVCGFETSWYHGEYSTWCAAFSTKELEIMEYFEDLTYYWKSGFGNNHTSKLGCELIRDMITKLDGSNKVSLKSHLYFGHSLGNRQLLVSLGIGKCQEHLPGEQYVSPSSRDNCWRTSHLTPFAANIVSVLYSCKTKSKKTSKIGVYINEKLAKLPSCNGEDLCDFETFKKAYSSLTDPSYCNRDFCSASSPRALYEEFSTDEDYDLDD